jgi:hypothetical protein
MAVPEIEVRNRTRGEITYHVDKGLVTLDLKNTKPPVIITISPRVRNNGSG